MTSQYNFILDASSFEKGLGNVKRWMVQYPATNKIKLNFYIPTYTLKELDFLQYREKSFTAKEALKFIDSLETPLITDKKKENFNMIIEMPDLLDIISWNDVLDSVNSNRDKDELNKIPRRYKNLLKSCVFKCNMEDENLKWILITEDTKVRKYASLCNIPWCSIVDADSILSREINDKNFQDSEKFLNLLLKNGGIKAENENGEQIIKTSFEKSVYASRGSGKLWSP